jgi:hypothetical protein
VDGGWRTYRGNNAGQPVRDCFDCWIQFSGLWKRRIPDFTVKEPAQSQSRLIEFGVNFNLGNICSPALLKRDQWLGNHLQLWSRN